MDLEDARVMTGALVTYTAQQGTLTEWGLILRCSATHVFVRFAGKPQPMAVTADMLTLEAEPVGALVPTYQDGYVDALDDAFSALRKVEHGLSSQQAAALDRLKQ